MKKRLICMLTLLCVCIASLASAVMVYADGMPTIANNYSITNAEGKVSSSEGGVVNTTGVSHGDMVNMYFNEEKTGVVIPEGSYIHVKGQVSSDIYRIKIYVNGAETISRLFDTTKTFDGSSSNGLIQLQADGTFEWHYSARSLFWAHPEDASSLGFQVYISSGSTTESIEFFGVVINDSETYDFGGNVDSEETSISEETSEETSEEGGEDVVEGTNAVVTDEYTFSSSVVVRSQSAGGVFSADFDHANRVVVRLDKALDANVDKFINIKGKAASDIYRFNLYWYYTDGSNTREIVIYTGDSRALTTLDENGYFEHHWAVDSASYEKFDHIEIEVYTNASGANLQFFGIAFDVDGTFNDWAGESVHTHEWSTEWSNDVNNHWNACAGCNEKANEAAHEYVDGACVCGREVAGAMTIGDLVAPESSDSYTFEVSKDAATGHQTITYFGTIGWSTYTLTISNLEAGKDSLYIYFTNTETVTFFYTCNGAENWTIGYKTYAPGANSQVVAISPDAEGNFVLGIMTDAGTTVENPKSVVFTHFGFEAYVPEHTHEWSTELTSGEETHWYACALCEEKKDEAAHSFVDGACACGLAAISELTTQATATIVTDETTGYQTITYSVTPGWHEFEMTVNAYDPSKTYIKVTFSHQNAQVINLYWIINGVNHSAHGWKEYGKGETVEYIDLAGFELSAPWTLAFFLDSNETLTEEKSFVLQSVEFVTEDDLPKAPEGLYFTATKEGGITCVTNANGGWDVSWNNDTASWRNVTLNINNYEVEYDILKLSITATAGTNVGIRWHYVVVDEDGETPLHARVRTHDGVEGIVAEDGTLELVYLAKAYNMQGLVQTKVEIWFDCPTGTSTNVGEQSATINSVELLKSSEVNFSALNITANEMTVDFTGEAVEFVATADADVELVVEYEVLDSETGRMVWTKSAPSKAGTYNVRVIYMGSLTYDYQAVASTLTINKVKAVTAEGDVVIDAETRVVTVAEGVIASLAEDFAEGYEVLTGDVIAYGSVIYYYRAATENLTEGDVLSLTFNRPVVEDESSSSIETSTGNSSTSELPTKGCFGSVAAMGVEACILMLGAAAMVIRRKRS